MPQVYEPREDSYLIFKEIQNFAKGKVLDMGTGSGVLAREAAKYSQKVVAVDINKDALSYAKEMSKGIKNVTYKYSNLFSTLKGEKFNLSFGLCTLLNQKINCSISFSMLLEEGASK